MLPQQGERPDERDPLTIPARSQLVEREVGLQAGALAGRALEGQRAAQCFDAVGQSDEACAAPLVRATDAVVADPSGTGNTAWHRRTDAFAGRGDWGCRDTNRSLREGHPFGNEDT